MPGPSKEGGGLEVKKEYKGKGMPYAPFKMKGSPFQRNFGIGRTESPDAVSPSSPATAFGAEEMKELLGAGLSTMPGGFDATVKDVEYERDAEGNLVLGKDGKPIPVTKREEGEKSVSEIVGTEGDEESEEEFEETGEQ